MHPELVVFEAEHDDEPKDRIGKVSEYSKFKDGLELVLNAVVCRFAIRARLTDLIRLLEVTAFSIALNAKRVTSFVIGRL